MSYRDVLCHLNGARSAHIASLVRLPQNDLTATKKILEMGPDAVLFPMVRSKAEFEELEKEYLALSKLIEEEWKKTKKRIRKRVLWKKLDP